MKYLRFIFILLIGSLLINLYADPPTTFDLRNYEGSNYVTSVKNQSGGTCWTHGTMAAIEGNLLMTGEWANNGEEGEPNLAEYHLDWWNGFNQFYNADVSTSFPEGLTVHMGGDYLVASAYLTRGDGAVRDIDGQSYEEPPNYYSPDFHVYYPNKIVWQTVGENLENIDSIKETIMEYGVMGTCMAYDGQFINTQFEHYQPPSSEMLPNHAISIVGWDDNRATDAPEPGAWLCKNSWGEYWGNDGYFWISYYDKWACREPYMGSVSFQDVELTEYEKVHYHDYHGQRDIIESVNEAFNAFQTQTQEFISAVSYFTPEENVLAAIKIYDDFVDGDLENELISKTVFHDFRGFHTIELDEVLTFEPNEDFFVYISFSNGGHPIDRTSDVPVLLGASYRAIVRSTANPNESFYKHNDNWVDLQNYTFEESSYDSTANFCMKALGNFDDSFFNPPYNLNYSIYDYNDIMLTWNIENPNNPNLDEFRVYENNELIEIIDASTDFTTYYNIYNNEPGSYSYYIEAVYGNEVLSSEEIEFELYLPAPENLTATYTEPNLVLQWETPQERALTGYRIYQDDEFLEEIGLTSYYIITNPEPGTYAFHMTAIYDESYESIPSDTIEITVDNTSTGNDLNQLNKSHLIGNYPNPFNPATMISFSISSQDEKKLTKLSIYNIKGQLVKNLVRSQIRAGNHNIRWNGRNNSGQKVSSGVYYYLLQIGGKRVGMKKLIMIK